MRLVLAIAVIMLTSVGLPHHLSAWQVAGWIIGCAILGFAAGVLDGRES